MVYKRKSISKMAAAAAAAAWAHDGNRGHTEMFAAVDAVILAVHKVIPDKAPAYAAKVAKDKGATDAMCTAIAAGVAAAAVGWEFKAVQEVSRKASEAFSANIGKTPAVIAEDVANAVLKESSRYPAVEAAAAAAYAAHMFQHPAASGNGVPSRGAKDGVAVGGVDGAASTPAVPEGNSAAPAATATENDAAVAAADAAGEVARMIGGRDCLPYAAIAAARAATFRNASKQSVFAAAVKAATPKARSCSNASSATGTPAVAIPPMAASAGATPTTGTPDGSTPATAASAGASFTSDTPAGATSTSSTPAGALSITATPAGATATIATSSGASSASAAPADAMSPADFPELAEHVAVAITAAFYGDSIASASLGACGKELLEALPNSHELIYKKLETIVGLDTFLAAFLLFSLTGRTEDTATDGEVVQTILQAYSFAVFLAATMSAGLFMVVTGGTYALTRNDLIVPTALSTFGFFLLLVTVADAIFLELGGGVYHYDDHVTLFWTTVIIGFLIQFVSVAFGVFSALLGSKYTWYYSRTAWPPARRVDYSKRGCFTGCCSGQ